MKTVNFKRSLLAASITTLLAISSPVLADSAAGSIYGKASSGTEITYKNTKTGVSRTITVNDTGRFKMNSIAPGTYIVSDSLGNEQQVTVVIGTGAFVSLADTTERLSVVGSRISSIDTSSVESSVVFTAEDIAKLPMARNSVAVALLAPGAIQGGDAFGRNLPSFGGSSIAENGYYIDGMDVTNLRTMLSFASVPQDAIAQTQVKTGGYSAEYGRSLGGVINVVTKSGSNEWEFGGSAYYAPDSLRASGKDVRLLDIDENGDVYDTLSTSNQYDTKDELVYNVFGGGAIIEDSLFFFANIEGKNNQRENYGKDSSYEYTNTTPNYLAKLDWFITDNHSIRLTHINNEEEYDRTNYFNDLDTDGNPIVGKHGEQTGQFSYKEGGTVNILAYTGHLTDDITFNAMFGKLENTYLKVPNLPGDDCPAVYDTTPGNNWVPIGCWNKPGQFYITDQVEDKDERESMKFDVDWVLGDHSLRFGYDSQKYDSTSPGTNPSGGVYYRYANAYAGNDNTINGVVLPEGTEAVRVRLHNTETATFGVENTAWYIEDNWQLNDDMLVYLGVRSESFENMDGNGNTFVESSNLIAPRLGFTWDVNGDSSAKLFTTLGRSYIPVTANTNIRSTRVETYNQSWYLLPDGRKTDGSEAPVTIGDIIGAPIIDNQIPQPERIADKNLTPMYQDEFIIGYQQFITDDWSAGAKFTAKTLQNGMDDFCGHDGFTKWAADNGYDNFDPNSMAGCMLINPGEDITIAMDLENDGNLTSVTTPNSYHGLPEYQRDYYGLELTADKAMSNGWKASFSYVLSRTYGNAEGYVNTSLAQEDPGATQDFDHQNFMHGSEGNLPTDRTHQFKAFGLYEITEELLVSANISLVSGIPMSCQGFVKTDDMLTGDGTTGYDAPNFSRYGASSFYCMSDDGQQELTERGDEGRTPWLFNADLGISYSPNWAEGLSLKATVFNVFNNQEDTTYDQVNDYEQGSTARSPNYLQAASYQSPRYVQFSAHYSF
ncbi:TonB-dependent receptor [Shewanella sp. KX20019]|uniref:TonB-dependent receptor plug domain-containing protein n=1 Tax=Shewanella sp. KX20019 TaxID=2803864 RepID=UPI00192832B0|nr:TonB-dependent receptor plug domain-containing protein [Shewanella sp. KX20019]QQX79560.1 TonB-dependent receptor [Shewanella sp. KX20019]